MTRLDYDARADAYLSRWLAGELAALDAAHPEWHGPPDEPRRNVLPPLVLLSAALAFAGALYLVSILS